MSIILNSSGGGSVTLQEPSTASNVTVTIPAATGDVMVSGNMPAFSAYGTAGNNQVISSATDTKVILNATHFDTASCFNTSTYRFTPNVAGYYQFSGEFEIYSGSTVSSVEISLFKNGTIYSRGTNLLINSNESFVSVNRLIYMNGSTDYIELYARVTSGGTITLYGDPQYRFLTGALVRTA